ncbi:MAG: cytochrome P450 [Deltaproteobacteria bacterium]|jgi:cytochrome P450 family 144|nr:cytochrome P450 [Deltaproteobacteria bacterium]MBT6491763.1 cytochrome P450 [Deltaproteobacteria bacterium]
MIEQSYQPGPTWVEEGGYYRISRYEEVTRICLDPVTFSSNLVAFVLKGTGDGTQIMEIPDGIPRPRDVLAIADAPDHTRQRKLLNPQFKGKGLKGYQALVDQVADELAQSIDENTTEWMAEFAIPLPLKVMSQLIGLPDEDYAKLKDWSDAGVAIIDGTATGDNLMQLAALILGFQAYLSDALHAASQNTPESLLGKLHTMITGNQMDHEEAVSILLQLVVAGSESTSSLIGAMAYRLASDGELQRQLRENPDQRASFVEEVLRVDSPFKGHFRVLTQDTEIGGVQMNAGTRLMLHWGLANQDSQMFQDPATVQHKRDNVRKHLAFGHGIHRCIGSGLAQMEAAAALRILLDILPQFNLLDGTEPREKKSVFTKRLEDLRLEFQSA